MPESSSVGHSQGRTPFLKVFIVLRNCWKETDRKSDRQIKRETDRDRERDKERDLCET